MYRLALMTIKLPRLCQVSRPLLATLPALAITALKLPTLAALVAQTTLRALPHSVAIGSGQKQLLDRCSSALELLRDKP